MPAPIFRNDPKRLSALRSLDLVALARDPLFQALAARVAVICETPIAHVVLVDEHRQRFIGSVGIPNIRQSSMQCAFVTHLVATRTALTVPDATRDARFATHPLVTGPHHMQFFAGAPIDVDDDVTLGSICVVDRVPRTLSHHQTHALHRLARIASRALASRNVDGQGIDAARHRAACDELREIGVDPDRYASGGTADRTTRVVVRAAPFRARRVLEPPFDLPDPNCLAPDDHAVALLWADDLSIPVERLREIVALVGPMRAAIRSYVFAQRRAALRVDASPQGVD